VRRKIEQRARLGAEGIVQDMVSKWMGREEVILAKAGEPLLNALRSEWPGLCRLCADPGNAVPAGSSYARKIFCAEPGNRSRVGTARPGAIHSAALRDPIDN